MPETFRIRKSVLIGLGGFLRPLARFLLRSGIGFSEFSDICKSAFVAVANEDLDPSERAAPASRISEVTGISRKEVSRLRKMSLVELEAEFWAAELNPLTQVLHFWHSDPEFSLAGKPQPLDVGGSKSSFEALVGRYVRALPPDLLRVELQRSGAVKELPDGRILAVSRQYTPTDVDTEFVKTMVFSLRNLTATLVQNAKVIAEDGPGSARGHMERYVWTTRIAGDRVRAFKEFSATQAEKLLADLDTWIGQQEILARDVAQERSDSGTKPKGCGFGVYYFEDDP
jgi:hypothetical protein